MKSKGLVASLVVMQVVLLVGMVFLGVQNHSLAASVKEVVASSGDIHEIYDDSKVVEAYKSGKTDGLDEKDKYVLEQAKKIIKENIKDGMTDYEKEKAIYDWQVAYVAFDNGNLAPITSGEEYSHMPYGVLKYHNAICVGNATTFKLFMDLLGIDCKIIHSTQSGEHAWDVVKLDDDWYHVDVTFDGSSNGKPTYAYFNVPDSVKDDGSYSWDHDEIPACNGTKYCYIANSAKELKDVYAIPAYLKKQMDEGNLLVAFTLKDAKDYTSAVADLITSSMMNEKSEVYTGTTYAVGDKVIYSFTVTDTSGNKDQQNGNQKVLDKIQEIIDGLQ